MTKSTKLRMDAFERLAHASGLLATRDVESLAAWAERLLAGDPREKPRGKLARAGK